MWDLTSILRQLGWLKNWTFSRYLHWDYVNAMIFQVLNRFGSLKIFFIYCFSFRKLSRNASTLKMKHQYLIWRLKFCQKNKVLWSWQFCAQKVQELHFSSLLVMALILNRRWNLPSTALEKIPQKLIQLEWFVKVLFRNYALNYLFLEWFILKEACWRNFCVLEKYFSTFYSIIMWWKILI